MATASLAVAGPIRIATNLYTPVAGSTMKIVEAVTATDGGLYVYSYRQSGGVSMNAVFTSFAPTGIRRWSKTIVQPTYPLNEADDMMKSVVLLPTSDNGVILIHPRSADPSIPLVTRDLNVRRFKSDGTQTAQSGLGPKLFAENWIGDLVTVSAAIGTGGKLHVSGNWVAPFPPSLRLVGPKAPGGAFNFELNASTLATEKAVTEPDFLSDSARGATYIWTRNRGIVAGGVGVVARYDYNRRVDVVDDGVPFKSVYTQRYATNLNGDSYPISHPYLLSGLRDAPSQDLALSDGTVASAFSIGTVGDTFRSSLSDGGSLTRVGLSLGPIYVESFKETTFAFMADGYLDGYPEGRQVLTVVSRFLELTKNAAVDMVLPSDGASLWNLRNSRADVDREALFIPGGSGELPTQVSAGARFNISRERFYDYTQVKAVDQVYTLYPNIAGGTYEYMLPTVDRKVWSVGNDGAGKLAVSLWQEPEVLIGISGPVETIYSTGAVEAGTTVKLKLHFAKPIPLFPGPFTDYVATIKLDGSKFTTSSLRVSVPAERTVWEVTVQTKATAKAGPTIVSVETNPKFDQKAKHTCVINIVDPA
jgi:hypothetical protein